MVTTLAMFLALASSKPATQSKVPSGQKVAVMCTKSGEQVSGMHKICYYNCLGSASAITIGSAELCPLTIDG